MRQLREIFLAIFLGSIAGCGSILFTPASGGSVPYVGTKTDAYFLYAASQAHDFGGEEVLIMAGCLLDLPLTMVLDTALFPVTGIVWLVNQDLPPSTRDELLEVRPER